MTPPPQTPPRPPTSPMSFAHLEQAYEELAEAIDRAGPANEALFLTKLALLLAQRNGDLGIFQRSIAAASSDLPENPAPRERQRT